MVTGSSVPEITPFSRTLDGFAPEILQVVGSSLQLRCPICAGCYVADLQKWEWHRRRGTSRYATCSKSCARKRYHAMNPGTSYFLKMPPEQRGTSAGTVRSLAQRAEISRRLKEMGHRPKVRGGNGAGMTPAEAAVREVLPGSWVWNFPVALGKRQPGYPTCYKLDFANPTFRIGLEVDGPSHAAKARKAQDAKKTAKLAELGWTVFRISNADVARLSTTSKLKEHLTTLLGLGA